MLRHVREPRRRRIHLEWLEPRQMLAADWQNPGQRLDVNDDLLVAPIDALLGINSLNSEGSRVLPPRHPDAPEPWLDTNGDGLHAPVDVLVVVNALNARAPLIAARLANDTAPSGGTNRDRLTSDSSMAGAVSVGGAIASLKAGFNATAPEDFVDVTASLNGNTFQLAEATLQAVFGGPLPDGDHLLHLLARNSEGRDSPLASFSFRLDTVGPAATWLLPATLRVTTDTLQVDFDEPLAASGLLPDDVSLTVMGGPNDGQRLAATSAMLAPDGRSATFRFGQPLPDQSYLVTFATPLSDLAGNPAPGTPGTGFTVADPPGIVSVSPAAGEILVNVTRETRVIFDEPVDPATVDAASLYLIANGARVPGRVVVSSTERFATVFYDTALPAATEVRVVVDGSRIRGRDGLPLDADGDSLPGGRLTADFKTLPLTRIAGTHVFGFVRDSYSGQPIVGATIRVDAFPEADAVTDANGRFELRDMPAPEFFVHIDGGTATNAPAGFAYPNVGKPFHSVPGQTVQLKMDGAPFDVFLPPMALGDIQPLSATEPTQVGFGPAGQQELAAMFPDIDPAVWQRMQVTYAPNSAQDDFGVPVNSGLLIPVPPDRIPAPLPPNVDPSLVISIQAPGATNFDVPAPLTFPNLEGLQPGEQSLLFGFDHDAGVWRVIGTGTVSPDGLTITSDPGVGALAPGWWFTQPGSSAELNDGRIGRDPNDPCSNGGHASLFDETYSPAVQAALEAFGARLQPLGDKGMLSPFTPFANYDHYEIRVPADRLPTNFDPRAFLSTWPLDMNSVPQGSGGDRFRFVNSFSPPIRSDGQPGTGQVGEVIKISIPGNSGDVMITETTDTSFRVATIQDLPGGNGTHPVSGSRRFGYVQNSDGSVTFYTQGADSPHDLGSQTVGQIAQNAGWTGFLQGIGERFGMSSLEAATAVRGDVDPNQPGQQHSKGIDKPPACYKPANFGQQPLRAAHLPGALTAQPIGQVFYRVQYIGVDDPQLTVRSIHGRLQPQQVASIVLPPLANYTAALYSPDAGLFGYTSGIAGPSGQMTELGTIYIDLPVGPDHDDDGLGHFAELIIGTRLDHPDTDGDDIPDGAEIEQGLDPLGGLGFPTGLIASLPLQGTARAVVIEGNVQANRGQTAYVATGEFGLAVVDVSTFNNPVVLGQLELPGDAGDVAVDRQLQLAAVATDTGGLQVVDVSDPLAPLLARSLGTLPADRVEVADGLAYVGSGPVLSVVDLVSGELLSSYTFAEGPIDDLALADGFLYAVLGGFDPHFVSKLALAEAGQLPAPLTTLSISGHPQFGRYNITAGGGLIYVASPDESHARQIPGVEIIRDDGHELTLIGPATGITAFDVAVNGSGTAVFTGANPGGPGSADVGLLDVRDPTDTGRFLTSFATPGAAQDVAIAAGIGFVADGPSGLQVLNFLPFDTGGLAPTVNLFPATMDLDPGTPGVQVLEGSTLRVRVAAEDDVQVRRVELLVDGQVVDADVSFPFDFTVPAPLLADGQNMVTVQTRAIDTGGNRGLSNELTFHLVPDTFPPQVVGSSPAQAARRLAIPTVRIAFNEPLDPARILLSGVTLVHWGDDQQPGGGDDLSVPPNGVGLREGDRTLLVTLPRELEVGHYQLSIDSAMLADRAGNEATEDVTLQFEKRASGEPLAFGELITDQLLSADEQLAFVFDATAGQRIYYSSLRQDFDSLQVQLLGPSGLVYVGQGASHDFGPLSLVETGQYTLILGGAAREFAFRLLDVAADPLSLDATLDRTLDSRLDAQASQFQSARGQRIYLATTHASEDFCPAFWTVYGPADSFVNSGCLGGDAELELDAIGAHTLVVSGDDSSAESLGYSLRLGTPETTTASLALGEVTSGALGEPGAIHEFTFTGTAGQVLMLDEWASSTETLYALIGPEGDSYPLTNEGLVLLPHAGSYRLAVRASGGTVGAYEFRLLDVAEQPLLAVESRTTGALDPGFSSMVFRVAGQAGQRLYFDSLSDSFESGNWVLYDPGVLSFWLAGGNLGQNFEVTLPREATYVLALRGDDQPENPVPYDFQVYAPTTTSATLEFGVEQTGSLSQPGEIHEFTFQALAGQKLIFDGLDADGDLLWYALTGPGGVNLTGGYAETDSQILTMLDAGLYTLRMQGSGDLLGSYHFRLHDIHAAPLLDYNSPVSMTEDLAAGLQVFRLPGNASPIYLNELLGTATGDWSLYDGGDLFIGGGPISHDLSLQLWATVTYTLLVQGDGFSAPWEVDFELLAPQWTTLPLALDSPIQGSLAAPGDRDIYTFTGAPGQRVYLDGRTSGGTQITASLFGPRDEFLGGSRTDTDNGPILLTETGSYRLEVSGEADATGDYSLVLFDLDNAATTQPGQIVSGQLNHQLHSTVHRFHAAAGTRARIEAVSASHPDATWLLYGPLNQFLSAGGIDADSGDLLLRGSGSYALIVAGASDTESPLDYELQIVDLSDAPVSAAGFGVVHGGTIAPAGQMTFNFSGPAGLPWYLDSLNHDFVPLSWEVLDPFDNLVAGGGTYQDSEPLVLPHAGTYTVRVRGFDEFSTGDFSLRLLDLSAAPQANVGDVIGSGALGRDATDAYQFQLTTQMSLYFSGGDQDGQPVAAALYHDSGEFHRSADVSSAFPWGPPPRTGVYYLLVDNGAGAQADYQFQVHDALSLPALDLDVPINGTLEAGFETDLYRFVGQANQRLYFDSMSAPGLPANWTVFDAAGWTLAGGSAAWDLELVLPRDGDYVLAINSYDDVPNSEYGFTIVTPETIAQPLVLGAVTSGTLVEPGERHILTFPGESGQSLLLDSLATGNDVVTFSVISPSSHGEHHFSSSTQAELFQLRESGEYRILVTGQAGAAYSARVVDRADQPVLALDTLETGELNPGESTGIWTFDGQAGERLFIDSADAPCDALWLVVGPQGHTSGAVCLGSDLEYDLPASGPYTLLLIGQDTEAPVPYAFQRREPIMAVGPLQLGAQTSGSLDTPGDVDQWTFDGVAGQQLVLASFSADLFGAFGPSVLVAPSGAEFWLGSLAFGNETFTLMETGSYHVRIDAWGDAVGGYSLRIVDLAAAPAASLGSPLTETLAARATLVYRLAGQAGDTWLIEELSPEFGCLVTWQLLSPSGRELSGFGCQNYGGYVTLPVDGQYVLRLNNSSDDPADVHLKVSEANDWRQPLLPATVVAGELAGPFQQRVYEFTATAGQRFYFDGQALSGELFAELILPDANRWYFSDLMSLDFGPFTAPVEGEYQLVFHGPGSFAFQLLDLDSSPLLSRDTVVEGQLNPGTASAVFRFAGGAGEVLALRDLGSTGFGGTWKLLDGVNRLMAGGNLGTDFLATLPYASTYVLAIEGTLPGLAVDYRFQLEDVSDLALASLKFAAPLSVRLPAARVEPEMLGALVETAVAIWEEAGLSAERVEDLRRVQVHVVQLPGHILGLASSSAIWLDDNGAGWGWFVDATPELHEEFWPGSDHGVLLARQGTSAAGRVDLLTVLLHELGHVLGLDHSHDEEDADLMSAELPVGQRRLPWPELVDAAWPDEF